MRIPWDGFAALWTSLENRQFATTSIRRSERLRISASNATSAMNAPSLEEALESGDGERLSESPRTGDEELLAEGTIGQRLQNRRLVNIDEPAVSDVGKRICVCRNLLHAAYYTKKTTAPETTTARSASPSPPIDKPNIPDILAKL